MFTALPKNLENIPGIFKSNEWPLTKYLTNVRGKSKNFRKNVNKNLFLFNHFS